jgi:hypothetical protein
MQSITMEERPKTADKPIVMEFSADGDQQVSGRVRPAAARSSYGKPTPRDDARRGA